MSSANILRVSAVCGASRHRHPNQHSRFSVSLSMKGTSACYPQWKMEDASQEHHIPDVTDSFELRFDRVLPSYEEVDCEHKREFGSYIIREAVWGEEYWTAAWLRAEAKWEDQPGGRYALSFKQQFADQEFYALKQRCGAKFGEKCTCIIAVKKKQIRRKHVALNSVVGTLDISIRYLLSDETFPGERDMGTGSPRTYKKDAHRYGYVSNLCVMKAARRQGIASSMLLLAVQVAESQGVEDVFVHVRRDNIAAQRLYEKIGFQVVEMNEAHTSPNQNHLMRFKA